MDELDGILQAYSAAPPVLGLERRILDRVHLAPAGRRWWLWTGMSFAALTVAAWMVRPAKPLPALPAIARVEAPVPVVRIGSGTLRKRPRRRRIDPEQALVAFMKNHPEEGRRLFSDDSPIGIEPLRIQELQ